MNAHEQLRLEDKDENVIAYFAPTFEWEPAFQNNSVAEAMPGAENPQNILDLDSWVAEIRIQGQFDDASNLPASHVNDLEAIFGTTEVTPQMQFNRAIGELVFDPSPPYNLYLPGAEYTANTPADLDIEESVFPNVAISEIRGPQNSGVWSQEFLYRFDVGFVR